MNAITAKELRNNLGDIVKRVERGEHLQVTYRNKPSLRIEPIVDKKQTDDPLAGLNTFLAAPKKTIPEKYKTGSIKQLYYEDMAKKYGVK